MVQAVGWEVKEGWGLEVSISRCRFTLIGGLFYQIYRMHLVKITNGRITRIYFAVVF